MGELVGSLGTLAARINAEHRKCQAAMIDTLNHALAAGVLLKEAKDGVKHKEWGTWLKDNFNGSDRTARVYMQLADRREEIEAAKRQGSAILSIEGALRIVGKGVPPVPTLSEEQRAALGEEERQRIEENVAQVDREYEEYEEYRRRHAAAVKREERITNAHRLLVDLALRVDILCQYQREEVSEALRRMPDADRRQRVGQLRDGVSFLREVFRPPGEGEGA